jgi:polyisoprenoid-binding protein YceI
MMLSRYFALACLLGFAPLASAQSYKIDPAHSKIAFTVHQFLGTTRGEFHKFSGTITVNREQPEQSSVAVSIQVVSIDTQIRRRDEHLLSAEFFDAKRYSTIDFRSRSIRQTAADSGDITGELTMKGTTRSLTLHLKLLTPATGDELPARTGWLVTADPISRKDFGLMFSSTAEAVSGIGQQVTPSIQIEAVRQ